MKDGMPIVCLPDRRRGHCDAFQIDTPDMNGGGPHSHAAAVADIDAGKMDGFANVRDDAFKTCKVPTDPVCVAAKTVEPDVMGYYDVGQIPNYWAYAEQFVLADQMFEPVSSSSIAAHLYMASRWSAKFKNTSAKSCVNNIVGPDGFKALDKAVAEEFSSGKTPIKLALDRPHLAALYPARELGWPTVSRKAPSFNSWSGDRQPRRKACRLRARHHCSRTDQHVVSSEGVGCPVVGR